MRPLPALLLAGLLTTLPAAAAFPASLPVGLPASQAVCDVPPWEDICKLERALLCFVLATCAVEIDPGP
jgi:hypothetical protein